MSVTLLTVTGLSPAIVTETIWALAKRKPTVIPDHVVFITTSTGVTKLNEELFTAKPGWSGNTVWEALRKAVKAPPDKLIACQTAVIDMADPQSGRTRQLDDIRTPEENSAAAEFIFGQVWNVVRDKNKRLIASVAGGRKTMGALLHSAVSLIGRDSDLLTHVLVDPPFDTLPGFFFPGQPGGSIKDRNGKAWSTKAAKPLLAEVPFVPLRNRFRELDDLPGSFLGLRDAIANRLEQDRNREIPIRIDPDHGRAVIDDKPYTLKPRLLALLEFILVSHEQGKFFTDGPLASQDQAAEEFKNWWKAHAKRFPTPRVGQEITAATIRKWLSEIRKALADASWKPAERSFHQAPFRLERVSDG